MSLGTIISVNGVPVPDLFDSGQVEYIEVYERLGQTTLYNIRYKADIENFDIPRLNDLKIGPGSVLSILVLAGLNMECLVKGPVFSQKAHLRNGGEGSWVDVIGGDASVEMDREFKSQVWPNMTDSEAVSAILATYGLIPNVLPTLSRHLDIKHSLIQRSTDLQFIKKLARRNGCRFWVTCNALGIETAHFHRPPLPGLPPAVLSLNTESSNVESLDIHWDVERPTMVQGIQVDLNTKTPMPGFVPQSLQLPLGTLNLQAITKDIRTAHVAAPVDDAGEMLARNEGALAEASWFIRATCSTSLHQLGRLARAHTVVNVSGAGMKHSGPSLVAGVRHKIDASAHKMDIELLRNGWEPGLIGAL